MAGIAPGQRPGLLDLPHRIDSSTAIFELGQLLGVGLIEDTDAVALDTRKPGVVATLKGYKTRGKKAIAAAAKLLDLTDLQVRTAVRYYGASPEEVDERIEREVADADAAEEAWRCEQAALA